MNKKMYIEWLRCIAMFCVVLVHVCITARTDFPNHAKWEDSLVVCITNTLHFAVPVFFMITGALFLNLNKKISLELLVKKYTLKYVLGIVVFGWGFAFMEQLFGGVNDLPQKLLKSALLMLQGKSWNHMWYLYVLVGIMLSMPIWKMVVKVCEEEKNITMMGYITGIIFLFTSVIYFTDRITNTKFGITFPVSVIYIGYLLMGYMIDKEYIRIRRSVAASMIAIASTIIIVCGCLHVYKGYGWAQEIGQYNSPVIIMLSMGVFALAKAIVKGEDTGKYETKKKIISFISANSYGVYIVHMLVINILYKLVKVSPFGTGNIIKIIVLWMGVSIVSLAITAIGRKIPVANKLL